MHQIFESFSPEQWRTYRADCPLLLTEDELRDLRGFNESISLPEVEAVYLPLSRLFNLHVHASQHLHQQSCHFLNRHHQKTPFIIGISGSVAVGKSTSSRVLKTLLSRWPNHPTVELVTTDGFLFTNAELEAKGLMERKGFPESYNLRAMIQFLSEVKSGKTNLSIPLYSHEHYDVLSEKRELQNQPDILIIEGLNLLNISQTTQQSNSPYYVSDFLDFTIYVDAETEVIKQWYLQRFMAFREQAYDKPEKFFHQFTQMNDDDALAYATSVWHEINEANLTANILPYKNRANLILTKNAEHAISSIMLRKL